MSREYLYATNGMAVVGLIVLIFGLTMLTVRNAPKRTRIVGALALLVTIILFCGSWELQKGMTPTDYRVHEEDLGGNVLILSVHAIRHTGDTANIRVVNEHCNLNEKVPRRFLGGYLDRNEETHRLIGVYDRRDTSQPISVLVRIEKHKAEKSE